MEGGILVIILYIDRNRLQFFQTGWSSVPSLDVPETVVRDIEVVSRKELQALVKSFLQKHAVRPSPALLVFSEAVCFSQVLSGEESVKVHQLEEWVRTIPFESVEVKRYAGEGRDVAIVIPKNFLETMEQIFEEEGFQVIGMVPAFALGPPMAEKRWLDEAMGTFILKDANRFVRQSIVERNKSFTLPSSPHLGGKNQRLMMFFGIFVFLILILLFFILRP